MKSRTTFRGGLVLCSLVILNACKKEASTSHQESQSLRTAGALENDPALASKVHVIISPNFSNGIIEMDPLSNSRRKPSGSGDATPPTVTITSPQNGATVSETITVSVNATDNVGVSSVNLSIDGASIANSTSPPYNFSWNTSALADGTHTLTAKAIDGAGNTRTASITVAKNTTITVLPPPPPPSSALSLQMPPVSYQGGEFSCVAFAAGYSARSAEQFYRTNASSYSNSTNVFSPEFLYDQTKIGDCGSGTSIIKALEFLKTTGICRWQTMPYSYTDGCSVTPNSSQFAEAASYKISSYSFVYKSDVTAIKSLLNNKHPLVIMVVLDNSFTNAQPGFVWRSYSGSGGLNHALTICGYDDAKHAWKVMNSWGTGWCEAGYGWIDYDFLPQTGDLGAYVMNY
jgi:hypothetical protein